MKKYFAIFAAVAVLGMIAIEFAPNKKFASSAPVGATAVQPTSSLQQPAVAQPANTSATTSNSQSAQPAQSTAASYKDGTYNGSTASTPFGDVQIAITVSGGKITDVNFLSLPNSDGHSRMVSNYASPELKSQTLSAQSASIDGVSGATYTSEGYVQSLQSAIDAAHV